MDHRWGTPAFAPGSLIFCINCLVRYDRPEAELPCDNLAVIRAEQEAKA